MRGTKIRESLNKQQIGCLPVTKKILGRRGKNILKGYQEVLMFPKNGKARVSTLSRPKIKQQDNYITNELSKQALPTPNTKLVGNGDGLNKYKKLVDIFRFSGGRDEAEIYLLCWGVPLIFQGLLLASAEYDAKRNGGVR